MNNVTKKIIQCAIEEGQEHVLYLDRQIESLVSKLNGVTDERKRVTERIMKLKEDLNK